MPKNASSLEIHFINVSQGDSILIINRDIDKLKAVITKAGKSLPKDSIDYLPLANKHELDLEGTVRKALLIDGGEDYYGGDVFLYVKAQGIKGEQTRKNFATAASHYHSDHVDGLRLIYKKKKGKKIVNNFPPGTVYDMGDDPELDPDTLTYSNYIDDINGFVSKGKTVRTTLAPGSIIDLGEDDKKVAIQLRCLAANGIVSTGQKTKTKTKTIDIIDRKKAVDQNDRSVVLVLEYGDFRLLLGGDAGGNGRDKGGNFDLNQDQRTTQFWTSYGDLETHLREAILAHYKKDSNRPKTADGHICCFKSHHHGSASSNDVFFIGAMQPTLVLCSSGTRIKFHGHPTQEAFNRMDKSKSPKWPTPSSKKKLTLDNSIDQIYLTEVAMDGKYGWGGVKNQAFKRAFPNGKILGDFVVRPFNEVDVAKQKGTNTISIQVYGTGAQAATDGEKKLRPVDTSKATSPPYPVGPWEHTCNKH